MNDPPREDDMAEKPNGATSAPPSALHLIIGPTGAGKTTYAVRLGRELGAVRFSIDEWMSSLFWMDAPDPIEPAWALERVRRCSDKIWETAVGIAGLGLPCVLEVGLSSRASRLDRAALAREAGLSVEVHFLDASPGERWARVSRRNAAADGDRQLEFAITREMFDYTDAMFEPPTDQEISGYDRFTTVS